MPARLAICSHFGFKSGICLLDVPVPVNCFSIYYFYNGGKSCGHFSAFIFYMIFFFLAGNEGMHKILDEFEFLPESDNGLGSYLPLSVWKNPQKLIMGIMMWPL